MVVEHLIMEIGLYGCNRIMCIVNGTTEPAYNNEYAVQLRFTQIGLWPTSHIRVTLASIRPKKYSPDQVEIRYKRLKIWK